MFFNSLNFMDYVWCFIVGGFICIIAQILIDKTKITPARILVLFVTVRCSSSEDFGIYKYIIEFAGAGATVPLTGFGANLAKGAINGVKEYGLLGAFTGGIKAAAGGIAAAIFFRIHCFSCCKTKNEEAVVCFFLLVCLAWATT